MEKMTFNPISITKKLLNSLEERPRVVLVERFGLGNSNPRTLESIGKEYGITRERVRQIEAFALNKVRKSDDFSKLDQVFEELKNIMNAHGGIVHEDEFLSSKAKDGGQKRHLLFLLVVGEPFGKLKENKHFAHSWSTNFERAEKVRNAIKNLHGEMNRETVFSEDEILENFRSHLESELEEKLAEEKILRSLLNISKLVAPNALGEWGLVSSPYIKPRGMRDYAFLVMRRHGSPMHFTEAAKAITDLFGRPAHIQTVHNEMIKDDKFVLVGRGLYALKDWGYKEGVVRNVIEKILSDTGALTKDEIIKSVLKERYIKENTILVNLQNKNHFRKDSRGRYSLV